MISHAIPNITVILRQLLLIYLILTVNFVNSSATISPATAPKQQQNFHLSAAEIIYDQVSQTVTAKGNVHIRQYVPKAKGWRHIYAHYLRYESKDLPVFTKLAATGKNPPSQNSKKLAGKVTARGGVWFRETNGDLVHSDFLELDDQLQQGLIESLSLTMADGASINAKKCVRTNQSLSTFTNANYSPCKVDNISCLNNKIKNGRIEGAEVINKPLWQLVADSITHDKNNKTITYRHVRLEIRGMPVFYLPYFSHPDPWVKRKSGLLFPTYGVSKDLGAITSLPVYYVISPSRDVTITPIITTKEGIIIAKDYRQRFYNGEANIDASYKFSRDIYKPSNLSTGPINTAEKNKRLNRWHLNGKLSYHLNDAQRLSLVVKRASDTTYLIRYPINKQISNNLQEKNLTSQLKFEHFSKQSYCGIRSLVFQTDSPKTSPLVLPIVEMHHQLLPDRFGGIMTLEGNFLSIARKEAVTGSQAKTMQRASGRVSWKRPVITKGGHLITPNFSLRADGYHFKDYRKKTEENIPKGDITKTRLAPSISLDWSYPLINYHKNLTWLLQPMVSFVANPLNINQNNFPNEDSTIFESDETNIFFANRFQGVDRMDEGYRVIYGVDNSLLLNSKRSISFLLGKTQRLDRNKTTIEGIGGDRDSDYIMRLKFKPTSWLVGRYRTALSTAKHYTRYSEFGVRIGEKYLKLDLSHIYLRKTTTPNSKDTSQLNWQLVANVIDNWSFSIGQVKNLKKSTASGSLANFGLIQYQNECFKFETGIYKTAYRDRDIRPDSGFLMQISFKNLGSFSPLSASRYPGSMLTQF